MPAQIGVSDVIPKRYSENRKSQRIASFSATKFGKQFHWDHWGSNKNFPFAICYLLFVCINTCIFFLYFLHFIPISMWLLLFFILSHFIRDFEYVFKVLRLLTGVLNTHDGCADVAFGIRRSLLFSFQIESLRYKEQLFSLNLEGNPICDKLADNIDFRLYIAAYLPKLKYYGYRVITNAERDKGREIYKYVKAIERNFSECVLLLLLFFFTVSLLCVCSSYELSILKMTGSEQTQSGRLLCTKLNDKHSFYFYSFNFISICNFLFVTRCDMINM